MQRRQFVTSAVCTAGSLVAQQTTSVPGLNLFFEHWSTPFGVPPFDRIRPEHFMPGFARAIEEEKREAAAVAAVEHPPTFANTIEALDRTGDLMDRVEGVFFNLSSAETNERLQKIQAEVSPLLAALQDDIYLDAKLFARVRAVWDGRESLQLARDAVPQPQHPAALGAAN